MGRKPVPQHAEAMRQVAERLAAQRGRPGREDVRVTPRPHRYLLLLLVAFPQFLGLVCFALGVAGALGQFGEGTAQRFADVAFAVGGAAVVVGLRGPLGRLAAGAGRPRRR